MPNFNTNVREQIYKYVKKQLEEARKIGNFGEVALRNLGDGCFRGEREEVEAYQGDIRQIADETADELIKIMEDKIKEVT